MSQIHLKTTIRCHYILIRMAKIKIVTILNAVEYARKLDHSYFAGQNVNGTVALGNSLAIS